MKKNRIDSFTCFVGFLLILALFFSIKLFAGIQDGKKQYLALVSLGDLTYDDDFLKKAKKIDRKSVRVGKECRSRWSPYH